MSCPGILDEGAEDSRSVDAWVQIKVLVLGGDRGPDKMGGYLLESEPAAPTSFR